MPFHTGLIGKYDKRYYEIYREPTRSDLKALAKQSEHPDKVRVLLTETGAVFAFSIELLHNLAADELAEEGISVVIFFAENRMEVADVGNLEHEDLCRAVQRAEQAFRQMGLGDDTQVRVILNQGLWGDQTLPFLEIVNRSW